MPYPPEITRAHRQWAKRLDMGARVEKIARQLRTKPYDYEKRRELKEAVYSHILEQLNLTPEVREEVLERLRRRAKVADAVSRSTPSKMRPSLTPEDRTLTLGEMLEFIEESKPLPNGRYLGAKGKEAIRQIGEVMERVRSQTLDLMKQKKTTSPHTVVFNIQPDRTHGVLVRNILAIHETKISELLGEEMPKYLCALAEAKPHINRIAKEPGFG